MSFTLIGKHEKDSRANRDGYVEAMLEMMAENPKLVHIDCDLMGCINTGKLLKAFPAQTFNAGIAEQNAMGVASGMAATGLTVTDVGVVNDANPTSSDAILAQSQTLVLMAQQLNTGNGDALHTIACMAQAIARNVSLTELTEDERGVMAHFKNPAMPSVAVTADAAIKIATARQEFASTDTFLEMIGFDQADIRRIRAQEQRARGQALLMEMDDADNDTDVE